MKKVNVVPGRGIPASMITAAGLTVRQALREKGTPYQELGLADPALSDEQLLDALMAHPILIKPALLHCPTGHTPVQTLGEIVLEILPAV